MQTQATRYLTVAETAKLVRDALKREFPGVTFRVRSSSFSMGSSVNVGWTDGPTTAQVDAVVDAFQGCDFDGMQDLKTYRNDDIIVDGVLVRSSGSWVQTQRHLSPAADAHVRAQLPPFDDTNYWRVAQAIDFRAVTL